MKLQLPMQSSSRAGARQGVAPSAQPHRLAPTPRGTGLRRSPLAPPSPSQLNPHHQSQHQAQLPPCVCAASATLERGSLDTSVGRYRCHSKDGAVVDAFCESRDGKVLVRVTASYRNMPHLAPTDLVMHWGMYRASASKWHHPKEAIPPNSIPEPAGPTSTGGMRSAMTWDGRAGPDGSGAWVARFEVPAKLAPLHLAFALYQPATDRYDVPVRATHFCVPVGMSAGSPEPLGASVVSVSGSNGNGHHSGGADPRDVSCAVNFAVFSRHASSVQLCLVRVSRPGEGGVPAGGDGGGLVGGVPLVAQNVLEIVLDRLTNRTGDVWHICVHGLKDLETLCWAWRADGEVLWQNGGRFHPGFMLMDPHATRAVSVLLPEGAHKAAPRMAPNAAVDEPVLLGSLAAFVHAPFDWQGFHQAVHGGQSRVRPLEEGVVVEVDVDRFTSGPDAAKVVPLEHRGKFMGILDRLDELKACGATTVMLSPVCLSAPGPSPGAGRSPLALFAPDPAYATAEGGPLAAASELKAVIRGLHRAGIEVVLQVEFCVTAEGGDAQLGRLQGLRGLDHAVYYRDGLQTPVLNCGQPVVRSLVVSALRHWASEYRVEGFCFVNAENLTQDKFGSVLDNPPLAEEIAQDPVLRNMKLVAAVGNPALLPRLAERGFPHWGVWMQVNDRYAADLGAYLAGGAKGNLSQVATRLTGSADLFAARWDAGLPGGLAAGRRAAFGLNAMSALGDRALPEVVGGDNEFRSEAISRSMLVAQFVSSGQPLIAASTLARPAAAQLVAALAAVRRGYGTLLCPASGLLLGAGEREVTWHSPYGGGEPDWSGGNPDPTANCLVVTIGGGANRPGHMLTVAMNPNGEAAQLALPRPPAGACWRLLVDTARPVPTATAAVDGGGASLGSVLPPSEQSSYSVGPYGAVLLDAIPLAAGTVSSWTATVPAPASVGRVVSRSMAAASVTPPRYPSSDSM